jgi:peptidoglycan/LPS O-acetylase OafA/YrhL
MTVPSSPRTYVPAIDWLKGFAIVCVVCIHAKTYDTTFVHLYIVNRAVPMFLVLLGATSETFWERHAADTVKDRLGTWYRGRFLRLVPPLWALSFAWSSAAVLLDRTTALGVGWPEMALTFLGYAPWIGTAWFITLVLQIVAFFPALRWSFVRLGPVITLLGSAWLCVYCEWHLWDIAAFGRTYLSENVPGPGWFYCWIFLPRVFWNIGAGVYLARFWGSRPNGLATLAAFSVWAIGSLIGMDLPPSPGEAFVGPLRQQALAYLLDVPLTLALLGLFCRFERFEKTFPLRALALLGRASWGIYLGHLFVHELLHLSGIAIETGPDAWRVGYAAFLLATGLGLALLGDLLRRLVVPAAPPRILV